MSYTITREDASEDLRVLRAAIQVASGFVDEEADAMRRLGALADAIEEQVKPAVEEPQEFGSVVLTTVEGIERRWCRTYSVAVDEPWCTGNHFRSWRDVIEDATRVEVLRVGLGEPELANAEAGGYAKGYLDGARGMNDNIHHLLLKLLAAAITGERKNAFEKAIQAVEELAP